MGFSVMALSVSGLGFCSLLRRRSRPLRGGRGSFSGVIRSLRTVQGIIHRLACGVIGETVLSHAAPQLPTRRHKECKLTYGQRDFRKSRNVLEHNSKGWVTVAGGESRAICILLPITGDHD
jgi:hypothetical protein